ncbi:hypothetical protein BDW02DRAFT_208749 [Decorospora gaudefroyi]|uniref:Fungal N-terminal domain-containing protein n=1 Tax=Decorospora gaudefroyi TaxID=184978 RepID=A0A6A5KF35_9PLEO|nr:hypothetical protein BDW02DRAFT_208749 [Decorospora gaudefroyi]
MSFGCSPADVLKLLEFSTRVYLAFKDANENSEAQVQGLVKEFTTFHVCLTQLGELMKEYGLPMPFPCKDFEATLERCEKTLEPYAEHLVDRKMGVKKFIYTIRYMGMEKEIEGLRKQIQGHYEALNMCISFLQLRLHLETTKQTQRLLDTTPSRTVDLAGRSYSTNALGSASQRAPLALLAPEEHPLYSEWKIFDRWLQREDQRIAHEAQLTNHLPQGHVPATEPSADVQTAAILYHLRQQVDDAILIEENREKRTTAEKRSYLAPSDAMKQKVRNMPPAPPRTYTLETNHSGDFTGFLGFDESRMSTSSATLRPGPSTPSPSPSPSGSPSISSTSNFSPIDWTHSPTNSVNLMPRDTVRTSSVSTNRSSMSFSPDSRPEDTSTAATTPENLMSHTLRRSFSRTSLATLALGEAALNWKRLCRRVQVERKSLEYGPESRECEVRWRYRENTGISLRFVYTSSQNGKPRVWMEQHFPATGPSIPLTTTHVEAAKEIAISIDFPMKSFGKLDKQYTDINYTFTDFAAAKKFQTFLYTNNGADPAELKYDQPVLVVSSDKNSTECRGRNLRLWLRTETLLEQDGPVTFPVLVLLFYTNALEDKGHWVEEPHYAFEWLTDSTYKKDSDTLRLPFSKDPSRCASEKLRKATPDTNAPQKSPSIFSRRNRTDSMEIPNLKRSGTRTSVSSNGSVNSEKNMYGRGLRAGSVNRYGYKEFKIQFRCERDRKAFLEVWREYVKPLGKTA